VGYMTEQPIAIKVEGLNEFVRNLKKMDRELPKGVRRAFNEAADIVVEDAVPYVPKRSGRAAASLRARSTQKLARVAGGGNRAPHYPWLDFGGRVGRNRSVEREFIKSGRYIYPSLARNQKRFEEVATKALIDVVQRAGIVVD
jgi:hypothetical protein